MIEKRFGKIIIPYNVAVWPHELSTAQVLSKSGNTVEFLVRKDSRNTKSPDILMGGEKWEIKSPVASKLSAVERNLKRACRQSCNIIFDSRRMKGLPDLSIQKELTKQLKLTKGIKKIIFINRKSKIIDISNLT